MKTRYIVFLILILVGFTGCSDKKGNLVRCQNIEVSDSESLTTNVEAEIDSDKVISIIGKFEFDNENSAASFYNLLSIKNEKSDKGYKLDFEIDGTTVIVNNFQYMYDDLVVDGESKLIGSTKDDFISIMTEKKFSCE